MFVHGQKALEPFKKRNRSNHQYSARLGWWLDQLAHSDFAVQHIASSISKFTAYLSRNLVGRVTAADKYDEEYVINILTVHAELTAKMARWSTAYQT